MRVVLFVTLVLAISQLVAATVIKPALKCGLNEEVDNCPPCPVGSICPAVCLPACVCKPGYKRNNKGICEKESCGANEIKQGCIPCEKGKLCPAGCIPNCVCKPGYKKDITKKCCVKIIDTDPVCGENEVKSCKPCTGLSCPAVCAVTCLCKTGYERNSNGKCALIVKKTGLPIVMDPAPTQRPLCRPCPQIKGQFCTDVCLPWLDEE